MRKRCKAKRRGGEVHICRVRDGGSGLALSANRHNAMECLASGNVLLCTGTVMRQDSIVEFVNS